MLISFSVTNFRSIKGKQTIDMEVATKYHTEKKSSALKNNFFKTKDETAPNLLKSAAIYGANASGKSNFIRSVFDFNDVVPKSKGESSSTAPNKSSNPLDFLGFSIGFSIGFSTGF